MVERFTLWWRIRQLAAVQPVAAKQRPAVQSQLGSILWIWSFVSRRIALLQRTFISSRIALLQRTFISRWIAFLWRRLTLVPCIGSVCSLLPCWRWIA